MNPDMMEALQALAMRNNRLTVAMERNRVARPQKPLIRLFVPGHLYQNRPERTQCRPPVRVAQYP